MVDRQRGDENMSAETERRDMERDAAPVDHNTAHSHRPNIQAAHCNWSEHSETNPNLIRLKLTHYFFNVNEFIYQLIQHLGEPF